MWFRELWIRVALVESRSIPEPKGSCGAGRQAWRGDGRLAALCDWNRPADVLSFRSSRTPLHGYDVYIWYMHCIYYAFDCFRG